MSRADRRQENRESVTLPAILEKAGKALESCKQPGSAREVAYGVLDEDMDKQGLANMLAADPDMTDILERSGLAGNVTRLIRLAIGMHLNDLADNHERELAARHTGDEEQ